MARYYLVQYEKNAQGNWQSPPECEDVWKKGCFKQIRFDNDSGVGLVKCLMDETLDAICCKFLAAPDVEIREWLATIERQPKSGPTPENKDAPVVLLTLDEEAKMVKRIGSGYVE